MPTRRSVAGGGAAAAGTLGFPAIIRPARGREGDADDAVRLRYRLHRSDERLFGRVFRQGRARRHGAGRRRHGAAHPAGDRRPGGFRPLLRHRLHPRGGRQGARRSARSRTMRQNSGFHDRQPQGQAGQVGRRPQGQDDRRSCRSAARPRPSCEVLLAKNGIVKDEKPTPRHRQQPGRGRSHPPGPDRLLHLHLSRSPITLRQTKEPLEFFSVDRLRCRRRARCCTATRDDARTEARARRCKVLRALKASMDEIMTQPLEPIFERAIKDFEIPGTKDIALLARRKRSRRSSRPPRLLDGEETLLRQPAGTLAVGLRQAAHGGLRRREGPDRALHQQVSSTSSSRRPAPRAPTPPIRATAQ